MKVKVKDEKNGICIIRLEMFEYIQMNTETYVYAKGYTNTQRETGVMTMGKISKADLPK